MISTYRYYEKYVLIGILLILMAKYSNFKGKFWKIFPKNPLFWMGISFFIIAIPQFTENFTKKFEPHIIGQIMLLISSVAFMIWFNKNNTLKFNVKIFSYVLVTAGLLQLLVYYLEYFFPDSLE